MSDKYPTSHLPVEKIDELRFKAFRSNAPDDVLAYYKAASLYFQDHYVREMNHEIDRDAAHAEGYRAGVEAAAAKCEYGRKNYQILNKDKITPAPFTTQKAARTMAALLEEDIRALLNSEADTALQTKGGA